MTPDDIAKQRSIISKMTPGPWAPNSEDDNPDSIDGALTTTSEPVVFAAPCGDSNSYLCMSKEDAAGIAAARTAWPAALDAVERLRAEAEVLKKEIVACHASIITAVTDRDACRHALQRIIDSSHGEWRELARAALEGGRT